MDKIALLTAEKLNDFAEKSEVEKDDEFYN